MARIRSVKPRLFTSPSLARVSIPARYLFVGLFTEADDEGRLLDSPKKIAGDLFPHDDKVTAGKVKGWLDELNKVESVVRYTVEGISYLWLPMFLAHQRIYNPTPSIFPAPPEEIVNAFREVPEFLAPEVEVEVEQGSGTGREDKTLARAEPEPVGFPEWYATYPRHVGRRTAAKKYREALRRASVAELMAGARRLRDDPNLPDDQTKIPHPATWLHRDGWKDDPHPSRNGSEPSRHPIDVRVAEIMRRQQ